MQFSCTLRAAGPFTDAQAGALAEYRAKLPTIGQRNRLIFDELVMAGPLARAQREFLLRESQVERNWQAAVGQLYYASHEV